MNQYPYPTLPMAMAAYLAGLFDGVGSVLIYARKEGGPRGKSNPHMLRITVTSTHEGLILWLKATYGGSYWGYKKPSRPNRARSWKWTVHANQAAWLLKAMLPYLVIKRAQAAVAIEFQEHLWNYKRRIRGVGRGRVGIPALPAEVIAYRESLRLQLLELRAQDLQPFPSAQSQSH